MIVDLTNGLILNSDFIVLSMCDSVRGGLMIACMHFNVYNRV